jgi:hypothetical protein
MVQAAAASLARPTPIDDEERPGTPGPGRLQCRASGLSAHLRLSAGGRRASGETDPEAARAIAG